MNPNNEMRKGSVITSAHTQSASRSNDEAALARLGRRQVLKRNFSSVSVLGFSCTVLVTWEAALVLLQPGLENGGLGGLFWSYILVWIGSLSVFLVISELASMAPTAGGQYHWVAMLSPPSCRKFLSYMTGFMNIIAWQLAISSNGFLAGGIIQGLLTINYPNVDFHNYVGVLIGYGVICVDLFINTVISHLVPSIESGILIVHIVGFFVVLVILGYESPHISAREALLEFTNGGQWSTTGLSFFVGLLGNAFSFLGADAAVHMAEEIKEADRTIPRAIILSNLLNGLMGLGILLVTIFGVTDMDQVLNSPTGYPFIQVFLNATNSIGGSTAMTAIVVLSLFFCGIGYIATSSRLIWSFSRDGGLPFSGYLAKVDKRSSIPLRAVLVTTIVGCLVLLIAFGSALALNIILSVNLVALFFTYFLGCALLLLRRWRGEISPYDAQGIPDDATAGLTKASLRWGPFNMSGRFGLINNIYACAWLIIVAFFSFWPAAPNPALKDMNWSSVITVGFSVFGIGYYFIFAKRVYVGPVLETEAIGMSRTM